MGVAIVSLSFLVKTKLLQQVYITIVLRLIYKRNQSMMCLEEGKYNKDDISLSYPSNISSTAQFLSSQLQLPGASYTVMYT